MGVILIKAGQSGEIPSPSASIVQNSLSPAVWWAILAVSNSWAIKIKYDCFYISFQEEIDRRTNEEKHFEEEELWYLLLTLAEAAAGSHQFQTALGDLKPSNLLLNKDGQIKLLGKLSLPCYEDSFDKENPTSSLYSP